jgi:predicted deacylase
MRAGASSGLRVHAGEIVARVGLEREHATLHAAVRGLVVQQRQHGLVAPVHAVEIADGQRAGGAMPGWWKPRKIFIGLLSF